MRVGTLAYATDSGLGVLAKSFVDHEIITDILRVEHPHYPNHKEWYPRSASVRYHPFDVQCAKRFCESVKVMFFFETPFNWSLIDHCRKVGVKTVMMPMHEYMPEHWPCQPDLIINPSRLDQQVYPNGTFLPVPVEVPWRLRTKAEVFVHNAGHGGVQGRNGTRTLLEAIPSIQSPSRILIRSQASIDDWAKQLLNEWSSERFFCFDKEKRLYRYQNGSWPNGQQVELHIGEFPISSLWEDGDVFIFPERFNGLSLPLQEACASGMLVMGTNRFPMNTWLERLPLIPVSNVKRNRVDSYHQPFDESVVSSKAIADTIDDWYGKDITEYSKAGKAWAEQNSWEVLGPQYKALLESIP